MLFSFKIHLATLLEIISFIPSQLLITLSGYMNMKLLYNFSVLNHLKKNIYKNIKFMHLSCFCGYNVLICLTDISNCSKKL